MTKISSITTALVLVLFLFALANSAVLAADIIFSDDFEDGNYSGWSTFGSVSINSWHAIGAYSVRLRATGRIWRTVSTAGYSDVTVEWYWAAGSLESSDHCYAEANTGSGWTIIDQLDNGEDDYTFRPGSASPSGADDNAGFRIRFRASGSYGDYCFVDNVVVPGESGAAPTPTPTPTPEPGEALDVAVFISHGTNPDKLIALMRAIDAMGHDVYGLGVYDIKNGRLTTGNFDVFVLGAGQENSKSDYSDSDSLDTPTNRANIRAFVNSGGGFVGIEQGANFARGEFDLYDGNYYTTGSAGKRTIDIVDSSFGSGSQQAYRSAGGGYLSVVSGATAVAENSFNQAVIVRDTYGSGRVVLSSFDLELRGDSELDWVIWDNWDMNNSHTNSEGCWTLLGRMVNWAGTGNSAAPTISTSNNNAEKVAVVSSYTDAGGAWPALLPGVFRSIDYAGYVPLAIRWDEINSGDLTVANFAAVSFPGGYAYGYRQEITSYGEQAIRSFASAGGGVMGTCAGSFYLSDRIVWEGITYNYPVNLFLGQDIGPLPDSDYPNYELMLVDVDDAIIGNLGDQYQTYYGGGYKTNLSASNATTVVTYEYGGTYDGTPNAIRFTYGNGHVLLIGTHPESRAGSNEDWIYWDNWAPDSTTPLSNPDNPWAFVDAAYDNWLIQ